MQDEMIAWADCWCPWCGERLPVDRHPLRRFCDRACGVAFYNDLKRDRLEKARAGKTCQSCGVTFTRLKSNAIFCSRACAKTAANRASNSRRRAATGITR